MRPQGNECNGLASMSEFALSIPWWRLFFMLPPVLVMGVLLFR